MEFKTTEPVQIETTICYPDGEPITHWRNALYIEKQNGHHLVIYANGEKEVLNNQTSIRKYRAEQS